MRLSSATSMRAERIGAAGPAEIQPPETAAQGDVGERVALAHEERARREVTLHRLERCRSARQKSRALPLEELGLPGVRLQETRHRDHRLVRVLLEELPLQHLGALVRVGRHVLGALAEVPQDRVRLRERPAVVEHQGRDAEAGIQLTEHLFSVGAVDDRELDRLDLEPEVGEEEANLVAVARDGRVVEQHVRQRSRR